ncbi:caspase-4-like isoform X3 [Arvicanthis niloticus]|uniref:caspase-4 isoform X3 n=1 Tax=Arvicanthis niloticus TaxID=61156 RepID=UPI00402BF05E
MCSNFRFTLRSFLHGAKELRLFLMAENNHPDKPLKILEKLGKEILTEYLEKSVQSNVVKLTEEEKEEFNNAEHSDKRRVIVDAMKRKHRKVGEMLLQTFLNVDPGSCHSEANPEMEEPEESVDTLKLCSPEEFARLCREKRQEIYPIKKANGRTRKALIICNIEFEHLSLRYGAQFDVIGMEALLKDLGYNVVVKKNLTAEDPGEVWIREPSKAQSCRAVDLPRNMEADAVRLSHVEKDFIAFYSTTPHHLSYRNETRGSCFITKLISCFRTHACSCHLFDIFLKVQQSFEKPSMRSQMPTIDRATLTRYFYLFPGN